LFLNEVLLQYSHSVNGSLTHETEIIYHMTLYKKSLPTPQLDIPTSYVYKKPPFLQEPVSCITIYISLYSHSMTKSHQIIQLLSFNKMPIWAGCGDTVIPYTAHEQNKSHLLSFALDLSWYLIALTNLQLFFCFFHVLLYTLPVNFDVPSMVCKLQFQ
jgi:hypothetical protein